MIHLQKRQSLKLIALIGLMGHLGLISHAQAKDWNKQAFEGKSLDSVLKLIDAGGVVKNSAIQLNAPDISENGSAVQMDVTSNLKATEIALIIEKNPNPLVGHFFLPAGTEPFLELKVKMAQTSNVYALMKVDGKWYSAVKEVRVTLGGCVA
jgi:sulfur-oxidizing protein SoxY